MENNESEFIEHIPCDECGSSDANSLYTDGHTYCFACQTSKAGDESETKKEKRVMDDNNKGLVTGHPRALVNRNITLDTSKFWDYTVGTMNGQPVQIANYKDLHGTTVAQKIRFPNKDFRFIGDTKKAGLFGQSLWKDGGKMVTVTEGEIDALSLSQAQGNKWAVVSVPNGAAGAAKSIRKNLEWLLKFDVVNFMFDTDEVGVAAAKECAALLPPSRAKIVSLPLKDANEMLVEGRSQELIQAMWNAKTFRPDGIVAVADMWERLVTRQAVQHWTYPFSGMNEKLLGVRRGEIVTFTAGSGVGKSAFCREISYDLMEQGCKVGYIALEENNERTTLGFMGIHADLPLHQIPDVKVEDYKESYDHIKDKLFLYDHWGSTEAQNLVDRIRFLVRGEECDVIILDHLSMVVSGVTASEESDERRLIDNTMTKLRTLVEELQCGMLLVSHLKRPAGERGFERGQETTLNALRGSAAIAQLSDAVVGLERDQQGDNPNSTTVRVLKNRYTGETGVAGIIDYQRETGRLRENPEGNSGVSAYDFAIGEADNEF